MLLDHHLSKTKHLPRIPFVKRQSKARQSTLGEALVSLVEVVEVVEIQAGEEVKSSRRAVFLGQGSRASTVGGSPRRLLNPAVKQFDPRGNKSAREESDGEGGDGLAARNLGVKGPLVHFDLFIRSRVLGTCQLSEDILWPCSVIPVVSSVMTSNKVVGNAIAMTD